MLFEHGAERSKYLVGLSSFITSVARYPDIGVVITRSMN